MRSYAAVPRGLSLFLLAELAAFCLGAVVRQVPMQPAASRSQLNMSALTQHMLNNTVTRFLSHELHEIETDLATLSAKPMPLPDEFPVNKVVYVILAMVLPCCGCDRCFMGQVGYGLLKVFSAGGFGFWLVADYCLAVYVGLAKLEKIDMLGYHSTFIPDTISGAFWAALILLLVDVLVFADLGRQIYAQVRHQQKMQEKINLHFTTTSVQDSKASDGGAINKRVDMPEGGGEGDQFGVPFKHQMLAFPPTAFTKALRKAGIVSDRITIPELIKGFAEIDKNEDGVLDVSEVREALKKMGASEEDVQKMMKDVDLDGDGQIDQQEFLQAFGRNFWS